MPPALLPAVILIRLLNTLPEMPRTHSGICKMGVPLYPPPLCFTHMGAHSCASLLSYSQPFYLFVSLLFFFFTD